MEPHNDVPRRIAIAYNTVVAKGTGVTVALRDGTPEYVQEVSGNAVFAAGNRWLCTVPFAWRPGSFDGVGGMWQSTHVIGDGG